MILNFKYVFVLLLAILDTLKKQGKPMIVSNCNLHLDIKMRKTNCMHEIDYICTGQSFSEFKNEQKAFQSPKEEIHC